MIKNDTVLILGAGSSFEVGFPLGKELINQIHALAVGKTQGIHRTPSGGMSLVWVPNAKLLARLLEVAEEKKEDNTSYSESDIKNFINDLWDSKQLSIDDFLSLRREYSLVGKLFILFVLSKYEDSHRFKPHKDLSSPGREIITYPSWGWYEYLWERLQEGTRGNFDKLKQNKLSIITFNYDRSIEHFLFMAIRAAYNLHKKDDIVAEFFKYVIVKHVYGELGVLEWKYSFEEYGLREADALNNFTPWNFNVLFRVYGAPGEYGVNEEDCKVQHDVNAFPRMAQMFVKQAKEIKTYHEIQEDGAYKEILNKAKRVYFLGCGYHEQNIKVLGLDKGILSSDVNVYGTAVNLTDIEKSEIQSFIKSFSGSDVFIANKWNGIENSLFKIKSYFRNIAPL